MRVHVSLSLMVKVSVTIATVNDTDGNEFDGTTVSVVVIAGDAVHRVAVLVLV